jgi:hypothetical protein
MKTMMAVAALALVTGTVAVNDSIQSVKFIVDAKQGIERYWSKRLGPEQRALQEKMLAADSYFGAKAVEEKAAAGTRGQLVTELAKSSAVQGSSSADVVKTSKGILNAWRDYFFYIATPVFLISLTVLLVRRAAKSASRKEEVGQ